MSGVGDEQIGLAVDQRRVTSGQISHGILAPHPVTALLEGLRVDLGQQLALIVVEADDHHSLERRWLGHCIA